MYGFNDFEPEMMTGGGILDLTLWSILWGSVLASCRARVFCLNSLAR